MKKSIILLFIFCASISAADWSSYGFSLKNSQKDSSEIKTDTVLDKNQNEITITYSGELTEKNFAIIEKFNEDFRSWKSMKVKTIKFNVLNDEVQIFVSPQSYSYSNVNIMEHLSSGILFNYRVNLMYNFRIMVEKLFVPIKGIYIDEKTFNDKIISAIKDPVTYINARDAEYLLEKLEKVSTDLERLRNAELASENGNRLVDKEVIDIVLDIKSKNPSYNYKDIYNKISDEKLVKTSSGIVRSILRIYYNEY
ncbi:MAG: hypothetical protein OEV78_01810 [Spirochaetia bacterium]|nr:hypothetical protein [Spirochaetia bacterium]